MNAFSRRVRNSGLDNPKWHLKHIPPTVRWTSLVVVALAMFFLGWLAFEGSIAKNQLEQARAAAQQTKDALIGGESDDATRFAENTLEHARKAQGSTYSVPWRIAAAVPVLGSPLKTTQQISDVIVGLADDVLLPGAAMGAGLSPDKLIDGTRLNLKLLRAEQPQLTELANAANELASQAETILEPAYLSLIAEARSQLQDQTSKLAQLLGNTAIAAQLGPSMLGADGPRTYLMGFQTNAEARGTGGLLGGFGILRFDDGTPTVEALGSNTELARAVANVDLGPEFNNAYGWTKPFTDFRNSNLSPHFPYAAQIWKSMWEQQSNGRIDGVVAIDPVALSYMLAATGPVTLADGEVITPDNVVELTMSTAYSRFPAVKLVTPQAIVYKAERRKQYLQDIAAAVVEKLTKQLPEPRKLLAALGKAASEGRIAIWSSSPNDQKVLEETPLAHIVPGDPAPYAQLVINNLAGNKMDYYLRREIEYAADDCDGDTRNSTITVRLSNTATSDMPLPDEVASLQGLAPELALSAPRGTMVSSIRLIATRGSQLESVTSNGKRTPAITNLEKGHPSFEVQVAIPPGESGELIFRLSEPTAPGQARVPVQPLIDDASPKVSVPACSG